MARAWDRSADEIFLEASWRALRRTIVLCVAENAVHCSREDFKPVYQNVYAFSSLFHSELTSVRAGCRHVGFPGFR